MNIMLAATQVLYVCQQDFVPTAQHTYVAVVNPDLEVMSSRK
jgi:hypothetical protein